MDGAEGIPVTGVSELVLEVADLAAAERFYAAALGLPVVERWPAREAIWLMAGDRTRIGLWRPQVGVAGGRGGAHVHFALHLAETDFDAAVRRLREQELRPQVEARGRRRHGRTRSAYVDDPDGNCVELWTQDVARYRRHASPPAQLPEEKHAPARFDATARSWDSAYDRADLHAHWWRTRLELAARLAGAGPGDLLEIGCGPGRLLAALAGRGWTVTGVDPAPAMLELARERVPAAAPRLTVARAEELPHDDATFDAVVAIGVLEYADLPAALRELVRVLKPGGRAVLGLRRHTPIGAWHRSVVLPLTLPLKRRIPFGRPLPDRRRAPMTLARAWEVLDDAGLAVERAESIGCAVVPDPIDGLAPGLAVRAATWAERSPRLRRALGTQRVLVARRA
jgi:SAM-dependent methyltransferase/catechol 2,3-dioxygenase-like lactoylglutathione lyase family enzyme